MVGSIRWGDRIQSQLHPKLEWDEDRGLWLEHIPVFVPMIGQVSNVDSWPTTKITWPPWVEK